MLAKNFELCLSNMLARLATTTNIASQAHFASYSIFASHRQKNDCQAPVCVVAEPTNIVLDKQNFKCLLKNVYPFGGASESMYRALKHISLVLL